MSAKIEFFKKIQENNKLMKTKAERVKNDITEFRSRAFSLAESIEQWLNGSGINVSRSDMPLNDETIAFVLGKNDSFCYNISYLRLQNGDKSTVLKAEGLYYTGYTGCMSMIVNNPERTPSQAKFILFMHVENKKENGWIIIRDGQKITQGKLLTEEEFFSVIEPLA